MSIKDFSKKVKRFFSSSETHDLYIVLIIILVAFSSFGLGRLSKIEEGRESVTIEYPSGLPAQQADAYSALLKIKTNKFQKPAKMVQPRSPQETL